MTRAVPLWSEYLLSLALHCSSLCPCCPGVISSSPPHPPTVTLQPQHHPKAEVPDICCFGLNAIPKAVVPDDYGLKSLEQWAKGNLSFISWFPWAFYHSHRLSIDAAHQDFFPPLACWGRSQDSSPQLRLGGLCLSNCLAIREHPLWPLLSPSHTAATWLIFDFAYPQFP